MAEIDPPTLHEPKAPGDAWLLQGCWNLRGLSLADPKLRHRLAAHTDGTETPWDLRPLQALDSAGAYLLWRAWGERLPQHLEIRPEHQNIFRNFQEHPISSQPVQRSATPCAVHLAHALRGIHRHVVDMLSLIGDLVLAAGSCIKDPRVIPWREISATIHETGGRALGITALVGFLIGVVVSYLSSLQLRTFGAEIYIVNILGLSIIRELGPLLAAILVAGRSGSAMTAQLGVMRVTQELDALAAMGISQALRLILPKLVALTITLPLLVVWTDAAGLVGGALSAHLELGISFHQFYEKMPDAVPVANYIIGIAKGAVFGLFIALIASHFGLRIEPNTESLGNETTNSVVASITLVIVVDAIFAIIFRGVGVR
jgi:phospholipid/cholesterol/gamma-HCH transport system permease protein